MTSCELVWEKSPGCLADPLGERAKAASLMSLRGVGVGHKIRRGRGHGNALHPLQEKPLPQAAGAVAGGCPLAACSLQGHAFLRLTSSQWWGKAAGAGGSLGLGRPLGWGHDHSAQDSPPPGQSRFLPFPPRSTSAPLTLGLCCFLGCFRLNSPPGPCQL